MAPAISASAAYPHPAVCTNIVPCSAPHSLTGRHGCCEMWGQWSDDFVFNIIYLRRKKNGQNLVNFVNVRIETSANFAGRRCLESSGGNSQHPNQPLAIRRKMLEGQNFCGCVYCVYVSACVSAGHWWRGPAALCGAGVKIFVVCTRRTMMCQHHWWPLTHRARKRNIHITSCLLAAQWPQSSRHTGQKLKM